MGMSDGSTQLQDAACEKCPQGELRHRLLPFPDETKGRQTVGWATTMDAFQEIRLSVEGAITARPSDEDCRGGRS